jgi:hypothetical protein
MNIMRVFKGYTLKTLLDTPFCHVIKLFQLAEKADALDSLTAYTGRAAGYDKSVLDGLVDVQKSKIREDKDLLKSVVTEEAKREAERQAKIKD